MESFNIVVLILLLATFSFNIYRVLKLLFSVEFSISVFPFIFCLNFFLRLNLFPMINVVWREYFLNFSEIKNDYDH